MKNKLPWIVSAVIFLAVLITGVATYHDNIVCFDIIGDGYVMGTDPVPVVIGRKCHHEPLLIDTNDFTARTIFSAIAAAVLGILSWGITWIALRKNMTVLRKIGAAMLMLALTIVGLLATTAVAAAFSGGLIYIDKVRGIITASLCLVVSQIGALFLLRVILNRKLRTNSPKRGR